MYDHAKRRKNVLDPGTGKRELRHLDTYTDISVPVPEETQVALFGRMLPCTAKTRIALNGHAPGFWNGRKNAGPWGGNLLYAFHLTCPH
jgi:hypothetical protein